MIIKFAGGPHSAAELRKRLGLAIRRTPGPLPRSEAKAFARIAAETELSPVELVDTLADALLAAHPDVPFLEFCSWFDPGIIERERRADAEAMGACGITESEVTRGK